MSDTLSKLFTPGDHANASSDDVILCYHEILRRPPDPEGLAAYQEMVEQGVSRRTIVSCFVASDEFQELPDVEHRKTIETHLARLNAHKPQTHQDIDWFHSMPFSSGEVAKGQRPLNVLRREADHIFKMGVQGKSLLDIGAWDGFFSFEAEKRGARDVLSTDHFCWSGPGWGTKHGYDFTHAAYGSKARSLDIDVFSLDPATVGTFDVVLFLGVLYHLKDVYGGLERAAAMAENLLIVETVTNCNHLEEPVMRHFLRTELDGDPTNFFAPNAACLRSILTELGFETIEIARNPGLPLPEDAAEEDIKGGSLNHDRHIVHAWRKHPWSL